jgi:hypothetical protein
MAIRRPSITSPDWLFQDFLYHEEGGSQYRYLQVKWDGETYERLSSTFDYSNPPFANSEQRGGSIVAQVDYSVEGKVVTVLEWFVNWRDEWPLRQASIHLVNCLYPRSRGYVHRVAGGVVYNPAGTPIPVAAKDPYAFWVSEGYVPVTNEPNDYLFR